MLDCIAITLDMDWAPDFAIDFVAGKLIQHQVRATWFVTHLSPAIQRLRERPELFELGIHPNFLPGSTHGSTPTAVINHCIQLVPDATSMRTHGLFQYSGLLGQIMTQTQINADLSVFLPFTPVRRPAEYFWEGKTLLRIPYFWEDFYEMIREARSWQVDPLLSNREKGIKVFNFHPIHIYMNSVTPASYEALKGSVTDLTSAACGEAAAFINTGAGVQTAFMELVEYMALRRCSLRIRDICEHWKNRSIRVPQPQGEH